MDFYKYINSKDVAEHLRKNNFELNSLQCLWIIFQNEGISLKEKISALKYILTMTDYEFKSLQDMSVHKMINEYFEYVEEIKKELIKIDDNTFYTGFIKYEEYTSHLAIYFKDYESCLEHIKENMFNTQRNVLGYEIHKIEFNTYEDTIEATYIDEELISIHKCGNWDPLFDCSFEFQYFGFSHPFKPGDILYDLVEERVVVLDSIADNGISAICNYVSEDGKTIDKYYALFFTNLEYYTDSLVDADAALYGVSNFIKNLHVDGLEDCRMDDFEEYYIK